MWKYLVAVLLGIILILGGVLAYRDYNYRKQLDDVTNQLAEKMEQVQETETAVSKMAVEAEDIKTKNKELQRIIKKRDQDILALSEINLKLKDENLKFENENARETVVDNSGNVVTDPTKIPNELKDLRLRVDFEKEQDIIKVEGFTLTNPAYAELKITHTKPLKLEFILTKDDNDNFSLYLDSKDTTVVPTEISLKVDPSIFDLKWYQRFGVEANVGVSTTYDIIPVSKIFYLFNITKSIQINPYAELRFSVKLLKLQPVFGVSFVWYPLR